MATVLQASQPAPPPGWITALEVDCQFVARPAGEVKSEPHLAADGTQASHLRWNVNR